MGFPTNSDMYNNMYMYIYTLSETPAADWRYHALVTRLGTLVALAFAIFIGWKCLSRHWVGFP